MSKSTTRRSSKKKSLSVKKLKSNVAIVSDETPIVSNVAEMTEKTPVENVVVPVENVAKSNSVPRRVTLVEGSTYTVRGTTFAKDRPIVVTDRKLLAAVEVNSRFKVTDA